MSLRFRRTVKIAPGLRLNVTKRGVSVSAGVRGARVTAGTSGTRATVGIPGSGLFYSEKLGTPLPKTPPPNDGYGITKSVSSSAELWEYINSGIEMSNPTTGRRYSINQLTAMARRLERSEKYNQNESMIETEELEYEDKINVHLNVEPFPSDLEWEESLKPVPFQADPFAEPQPKKNEIESRMRLSVFQENKLPVFDWTALPAIVFLSTAILSIGLRIQVTVIASAVVASVFSFIYFIRIHRKRNLRKSQLEDEVLIQSDAEFSSLKAKWEAASQNHNSEIAQLKSQHIEIENARIATLKKLMDGDLDTMQSSLSRIFTEIDSPFETQVAFEMTDAQLIYLDVDLPEIEDSITTVAKRILKSGEIKEKNKPKKLQNQEYARMITGLAFYLTSQVFSVCPTIEKVIVSGYTQRLNKSIGHIEDQYVYSIVIDQNTFEQINFQAVDPIKAFNNFEARLKISASFALSIVKPHQPNQKG